MAHCSRPSLVGLVALVAACFASPSLSQSKYPDRPVTLVVSFEAGGPTDVNARILADKLSTITGQRFIVENKPGAGGILGNQAVQRAQPDGYTLLFASSGSMTIIPATNASITYDPLKDFESVALISNLSPFFVVTNGKTGIKDVKSLVEQAKAAPNKFKVGTPGPGAMNSVTATAFADVAKIQIVDVPYKGTGPAVAALVSHQVDLSIANTQTFKEHVQSGSIVPLAVVASARSPQFPEVPTIAEAGFPEVMELTSWVTWQGVFAPKGTPKAVIDALSKAINEAQSDPELQKRFASLDLETRSGSTPESTAAFLSKDLASWRAISARLNIKPQ